MFNFDWRLLEEHLGNHIDYASMNKRDRYTHIKRLLDTINLTFEEHQRLIKSLTEYLEI